VPYGAAEQIMGMIICCTNKFSFELLQFIGLQIDHRIVFDDNQPDVIFGQSEPWLAGFLYHDFLLTLFL